MLVLKKSYTNCATEIENTCLLQNQFHNGLKSPCCSDFSKKMSKMSKMFFPVIDGLTPEFVIAFPISTYKNEKFTCNM